MKANAIDGRKNKLWKITELRRGTEVSMRVKAPDKDKAITKAHKDRIDVVTCEIAKPVRANAARQ